ncbi:3'-5' exonuclease [Photobacterium angustum]|uniref:3'-5' exonuclease n=1 Tax=Photobacterium angustum TaxID=661 RepID=A0A855SBP7_PHOAN|nr:3'-5' exonuclease [Photobacterium angustum]KJF82005.1 DNA polymerase III subunit epsilon [Photobacterium damselae subsp. damselae]KJG38118.1 DNA polymerase III subunit epsilon [Photobacterium angustum]KJG45781.1 DNA polymerase III subunit epsilon [Photobacterium angustum]KJG49691.1 DNA polymerase III subunit epsilon [Photobacterium angustum]PSX07269.1 3'-5' exonuclease [Photobacterium angustum]
MFREVFKKTSSTHFIRNTPIVDWQKKFAELAHDAKDQRIKQYYQNGIFTGDTPLKDIEFVALDFETTGLNANKDDIISVGLVPFTINRIFCKQSQHWVVKPKAKLDEDSVIIHGITHSDVQTAPDIRRILEAVLDSLAGKVVVVHYKAIERQFMDKALRVRLNEGIQFPVVDTLALESHIQTQQYSGFLARLKGKKPGSVRLGKCRIRYGLPAYQPHHALTDALATAELLQAQIAYHFTPDTPINQIWE